MLRPEKCYLSSRCTSLEVTPRAGTVPEVNISVGLHREGCYVVILGCRGHFNRLSVEQADWMIQKLGGGFEMDKKKKPLYPTCVES